MNSEENTVEQGQLGDLIRRSRLSDLVAQESLVKLFQVRVAGFVFSMIGRQDGIEDITQNVFIKMLNGLASLKKPEQFQSWLFRIARNACLDHIRTQKWKDLFIRFDKEHEEIASRRTKHFSEELEWLWNELQTLPANQREVLVLLQDGSLSYQEIADILGCSLESVKSRIFRARNALNQRRKYGNESG